MQIWQKTVRVLSGSLDFEKLPYIMHLSICRFSLFLPLFSQLPPIPTEK